MSYLIQETLSDIAEVPQMWISRSFASLALVLYNSIVKQNAKTKSKTMEDIDKNGANSADKIQSLREMIQSAEKTIQGAKAMLLQLEGKKKVGRRRKSFEDSEDGRIIEGTFDG